MIPADAWPAGDILEWGDDETRTHHDFAHDSTRPYTAAENAAADERAAIRSAEQNRVALLKAARDALATNRAYLALNTPTGAQSTAQTKNLTRQMNAVIRLIINDLTGTD